MKYLTVPEDTYTISAGSYKLVNKSPRNWLNRVKYLGSEKQLIIPEG